MSEANWEQRRGGYVSVAILWTCYRQHLKIKDLKMFKIVSSLIIIILLNIASCTQSSGNKDKVSDQSSIAKKDKLNEVTDMLNIPFQTIDGDPISLSDYAGNVILIVNVASKCGYTRQYSGLEELYRTYKDSGLVIFGFPANNFGGQEPGTNEEIAKFCSINYDVTFPMMSKISVKGEDKHPLFVALTEKSDILGEISWNFSKFLFDRQGKLVKRFDSKVEPMSEELVGSIKEIL
jgi:glutathione peroxidase